MKLKGEKLKENKHKNDTQKKNPTNIRLMEMMKTKDLILKAEFYTYIETLKKNQLR